MLLDLDLQTAAKMFMKDQNVQKMVKDLRDHHQVVKELDLQTEV